MRNINVYLRLGHLPLYKYLVEFPPKRIVYNIPTFTTTNDFDVLKEIKRFIWKNYTKVMPPALKVDVGKNELIHSCYGMMILNKFPWVVDVEHYAGFANFNIGSLNLSYYKNKIINLLSSDYCKKIIPWTYAAKKSIENYFKNKKINEKLEVVYPAVKLKSVRKIKNEKIKLLVVSRHFYEKGGKQSLDIFEILNKKYDISLTVISNVPKEIKRRYRYWKNIKFIYPNLTIHELVKNYYSQSDILLHITFADTFGGTLLEAMACGLPIVGTDMFAMPEIIQNGKNGFLIHTNFSVLDKKFNSKYHPDLKNWNEFISKTKKYHKKLVEDSTKKVAILIEDDKLRRKMGKYGKWLTERGKFSIKVRNKKLRKIYEESLC